ncbi:MAG: threonylcarbamoyl-AMP synthase [Gemmatimonadota bacterium]|jgi:L-threonylcarbamoyladenylate synthase|nr:threonylcarbamoyl-AMP synthase [Gemmatimonadota bacterium]
MKRFSIDSIHPEPEIVEQAAAILRGGGTVAFPTETVYGLGGNALDPEAIARIYAAKGRPSFNPLIVHCADTEAARSLAAEWTEEAEQLARIFWPGPLTLVVRKREVVPDTVTAGLPNVALRVPAHPVAAALLRAAGVPIAAPSANRYTELSPTTAAHVEKSLGGRINALLDGGPTRVGLESTVVDLSGDEPVLLRPGLISATDLETALGRSLLSPKEFSGDAPRPAPGMVRRHYAPRAPLFLIPGDDIRGNAQDGFSWLRQTTGDPERDVLTSALRAAAERGERVAVLLSGGEERITGRPVTGSEDHVTGGNIAVEVIRMPLDPATYGSELYAVLHRLDEEGYGVVLVEQLPLTADWAAVRDRLERASDRGD